MRTYNLDCYNIEPTEYNASSNKEYKKLVELICRNEEKLRATITDAQKELFEKYTDCEKRLRRIAADNIGENYIMEVGSQIRIKRTLFEQYLDGVGTI